MKKLVLILGLLFITSSQTMAVCVDYSNMCAPKAYDLTSRGGQIASKITGMTFLSEKIAQAIIKKELKKATKEKFKVQMDAYSAFDLAHGRFKSLKLTGKNLDLDGVYLTSLEAQTLCGFNYIQLDKKNIKFKENMVMGYKVEISNNDLQKTVKSTGYLDMLNKIKLSAMGITFFKLDGADVKIKNNKLQFTINLTSPLISVNSVPIVVRSDVKVEDGSIVLTKIDLANLYTIIDLSRLTYLLNALNPLTFSMDVLNNKESKMKVQDVDIINDKIIVKGSIFVPKNSF